MTIQHYDEGSTICNDTLKHYIIELSDHCSRIGREN